MNIWGIKDSGSIWLVCCIQCRVTFKSGANQATLNQLVREVKALNSDFLGQDISSKAMGNVEANYYLFLMHVLKFLNVGCSPGAAYRFYQSKCEQLSVQRRGKEPLARTQRRRRERISRVCNSYTLNSVVACACLTSCTASALWACYVHTSTTTW